MTRPSGGFLNYYPVTSQSEASAVWSLLDVYEKKQQNLWPLKGNLIRFIVVGGGGSTPTANSGTNNYTTITGGGGAGGVVIGSYLVTQSESITITIGAGAATSANYGGNSRIVLTPNVYGYGGQSSEYSNTADSTGGSGGGSGVRETTGSVHNSYIAGTPLDLTTGNKGADGYAADTTNSTIAQMYGGGGGGFGGPAVDQDGGPGINLLSYIGYNYIVAGGGGGGGGSSASAGFGGSGGGGNGTYGSIPSPGLANTGGGAGGTGVTTQSISGAAGGSGVVFFVHKTTAFTAVTGGSVVTNTSISLTTRQFNASGTLAITF